jgi:PPP family 3-phenylpropionic acid transporter
MTTHPPSPPPSAVERRAAARQLAGFYAAYFAVIGLLLPFWSVWLSSRGLDAVEVGLVLAAGQWARVPAGPWFGALADRRGIGRVMLSLAAAGLVGYAAFGAASRVWMFVVLGAVVGVAFQSVIPLGESLTLRTVARLRLDYGRLRLWGSLAFIATSVGGGQVLAVFGVGWALPLIVGFTALTALAVARLPALPRAVEPARRGDRRAVLARPTFVLFLATAAAISASHAAYYGFASLHWTAAGHSPRAVGLLFAEGVIAEIAVFWFGSRLTVRFAPSTLLLFAAVGGGVRWTALATTTAAPLLALAQPLHGLSFAAMHLGAMSFLSRRVPERLAATAQSVYAVVAGAVALGSAVPVCGWLFETEGAAAFRFAARLAAAGGLGALALRASRRYDARSAPR